MAASLSLLDVDDVFRTLSAADPAGLVPDRVLRGAASALTNRSFAVEVRHKAECATCHQKLELPSKECHILTTAGLLRAVHVPQRCSRRKCPACNTVIWANFAADARGTHVWLTGSARPEVAMMSSSFGVTWGWHKQFSHRVLH